MSAVKFTIETSAEVRAIVSDVLLRQFGYSWLSARLNRAGDAITVRIGDLELDPVVSAIEKALWAQGYPVAAVSGTNSPFGNVVNITLDDWSNDGK